MGEWSRGIVVEGMGFQLEGHIFEEMEKGGIVVGRQTFSLLEFQQAIQSVLQKNFGLKQIWVHCELLRISVAPSGHCYLELVQKSGSSVIAQQRGIIWSDKFAFVSKKFSDVTKTSLASGMKIMVQCAVNFHPVYGLSLTIQDIEPGFTLGEMAKSKSEAIARLKFENLFDQNRKTRLATLPARIAVISVDSSRGYQDFISTLSAHPSNYRITLELFEAVLQGENAVSTITYAIRKIAANKARYDAIAIIRGGAGDAGLSCYDEYSLASMIAACPLPVITGIGHSTNETVSEMVSHKNCITPTAAATFILERFDVQANMLSEMQDSLQECTADILESSTRELRTTGERFRLVLKSRLKTDAHVLERLAGTISGLVAKNFSNNMHELAMARQALGQARKYHVHFSRDLDRIALALMKTPLRLLNMRQQEYEATVSGIGVASSKIENSNSTLNHLEEKINLLSPQQTLKRGYSITRLHGKALTHASKVKKGDELITTLSKGTIISTVDKTNKHETE